MDSWDAEKLTHSLHLTLKEDTQLHITLHDIIVMLILMMQ